MEYSQKTSWRSWGWWVPYLPPCSWLTPCTSDFDPTRRSRSKCLCLSVCAILCLFRIPLDRSLARRIDVLAICCAWCYRGLAWLERGQRPHRPIHSGTLIQTRKTPSTYMQKPACLISFLSPFRTPNDQVRSSVTTPPQAVTSLLSVPTPKKTWTKP